jgi:hypothetical protein
MSTEVLVVFRKLHTVSGHERKLDVRAMLEENLRWRTRYKAICCRVDRIGEPQTKQIAKGACLKECDTKRDGRGKTRTCRSCEGAPGESGGGWVEDGVVIHSDG